MEDIYNLFEKPRDPDTFDAIKIKIASPEKIREWSYGEVTKPETINYRTFKPERGGLFCAKIFGPIKDWECLCGKYKRMKHRGVVCDKCGVEVIQSKVRRERLGHINLACPVSHVWFFKGLPSRIGHLLDMSLRDLEKILYFELYVVTDPGGVEPAMVKKRYGIDWKEKALIDEEAYQELRDEYGSSFKAGMGAEAIRELLIKIDPEALAVDLRERMRTETSAQKKKKIVKRLSVVDSIRSSGNRPEWMILEVIPVIPPELRPLVPLDGGRFATSDLNDLYRRVINRNNRLKRLQELKAPDVIIRNEKRMLQEAVDALFDNGRRGRVLKGPNNRPLRSLSDMLKGKQGRFRQNLLGKRVDYSGRSVIVIGPELRLNQCGLPKRMALELFKPFIFNKLEENGYVTTIKSAKKMVEQEKPEVWDILEEVIQEHPVLLNRAPTLHRLGIQAFQPVLIEGKAIRIHPLVCKAFNADFDGDQMAVHIPLSPEAQLEAHLLMLAPHNILSPANGKPIAVPTQDIVLGSYYLTSEREQELGEGMSFRNPKEVLLAHHNGAVGLQAKIFLRSNGELRETTVGRVLFNEEVLPDGFEYFNEVADKSSLSKLILEVFNTVGSAETVRMLDRLKKLGFFYATRAGISIGIVDMLIPRRKPALIDRARREVIEVEQQYRGGLITNGERYNKVVDIWSHVTEQVAEEMFKDIEKNVTDESGMIIRESGSFNPINMMSMSGARGSRQQIRQLAGMRGLMAKPSGEIIETPITANFREGLTVIQYFISTHGARKGLADTALKTADSGYLTRRLVDVSQDVIITEDDCGTLDGIIVNAITEGGEIIEPLSERILGRVALEDIFHPFTRKPLVKANDEIDEERAHRIEESGVERVKIRSVLTCEAKHGVCARCYGRNLATGHLTEIGEAVGVIAAQSIGEPGTQLTMRTFHIGGAARAIEEEVTAETKAPGFVRFLRLNTDSNSKGETIIISRKEAYIFITQPYIIADRDGVVVIEEGERDDEGHIGVRLRLTDKDGVEQLFSISPREFFDPTTREFEGKARVITKNGQKIKAGDIVVERIREFWTIPDRIPYGARLRVLENQQLQTSVRASADGIAVVRRVTGDDLVECAGEETPVNRRREVTSHGVFLSVMHEDNPEREIDHYYVIKGAKLLVNSGDRVTRDQLLADLNVTPAGEAMGHPRVLLADWDPFTIPILAESEGVIDYEDVVEGVTLGEERDEVTGQVRKVIGLYREEVKCPVPKCSYRESKRKEGRKQYCPIHGSALEAMHPHFLINPGDLRTPLPLGAHLVFDPGVDVKAGDVVAILLRESTKTKDITGGLPRVVELFEARKPRDPATISEVDGMVTIGQVVKGMRQVLIKDESGEEYQYSIPKGTHITVHNGDRVRAGEPLMDGSIDPHDILTVLGEKELQKYLVNEVQEVYRLQGVDINDKHIEVIVKQMLKMVKIEDAGDTTFVLDQQVEKARFNEENERVMREGGRPAQGTPQLLGITKAALSTESFISAASFQETTRVLTEASISGKVDYLRGLKENVVVGRLVPAGTGAAKYHNTKVEVAPDTHSPVEEDESEVDFTE
ncbi:DNA-directed RNA polymerase subunit beta' [bacterium]|nr:DNA-directed RNA polymerase subunit beta' [candidate division CSSED10-310 bacterium]